MSDRARVFVLGTYHFANPGRDVIGHDAGDIASKQPEVAEVVEALARFEPTKVAVEVHPFHAPRLAERYDAYRAGTRSLGPGEEEQIGFRLAHRFDHPRVYAIDAEGEFPYHEAIEYARRHDPGFLETVEAANAASAEENRRIQSTMTVGQILRHLNDPERLATSHGWYMAFARLGYVGTALIEKWYARNIRIFANLASILEPGDRVLVVFGAGHAPILRHLVDGDPELERVDPGSYLPV